MTIVTWIADFFACGQYKDGYHSTYRNQYSRRRSNSGSPLRQERRFEGSRSSRRSRNSHSRSRGKSGSRASSLRSRKSSEEADRCRSTSFENGNYLVDDMVDIENYHGESFGPVLNNSRSFTPQSPQSRHFSSYEWNRRGVPPMRDYYAIGDSFTPCSNRMQKIPTRSNDIPQVVLVPPVNSSINESSSLERPPSILMSDKSVYSTSRVHSKGSDANTDWGLYTRPRSKSSDESKPTRPHYSGIMRHHDNYFNNKNASIRLVKTNNKDAMYDTKSREKPLLVAKRMEYGARSSQEHDMLSSNTQNMKSKSTSTANIHNNRRNRFHPKKVVKIVKTSSPKRRTRWRNRGQRNDDILRKNSLPQMPKELKEFDHHPHFRTRIPTNPTLSSLTNNDVSIYKYHPYHPPLNEGPPSKVVRFQYPEVNEVDNYNEKDIHNQTTLYSI